jgi:polyphenol oxidase
MNCRLAPPHAVRNFTLGEHALDEALAITLDGGGDARNVGRIDAEADDGGHPFMILPRPGGTFEWRDAAHGPVLVCSALADVAAHLFTSRDWSASLSRSASLDGWGDIGAFLGVGRTAVVRLRQVHGREVVCADAIEQSGDSTPEADIVIASRRDRAIAVRVADCVPLLLADRRSGAVAAAHAGWRGLALGVPGLAVDAMTRTFGSRASDIVAAVGPSVGACCYEVGPEVRDAFRAGGFRADDAGRWFNDRPVPDDRNPPMPGLPSPPRTGRWYFDGSASARDQLIAAGIPPSQIYGAGLCTASHIDLLCSYRREGSSAGRLAAVIIPSSRP